MASVSLTSALPSRPVIGLLGGAGPYATAHLHQRLITAAQRRGATEDHEFPGVLVWNAASPVTTVDGVAAGEELELLAHLIAATRWLQEAGAQILLPACNTFDMFTCRLQAELDVELLSLPRLAAARAAAAGHRRVAVLCSQTARRLGLHARALHEHGIDTVAVTDGEQRQVNALIAQVMSAGASAPARDELQRLCTRLHRRGAETVVIGCTELSALGCAAAHVIDSAQTAVDSALELLTSRQRTTHAGL